MSVVLTTAILDAWVSHWEAQAIPFADAWRPGLTEEELAAVEDELGTALPPELRTWWSWHDGLGLVSLHGRHGVTAVNGVDIEAWPAHVALDRTRTYREIMARVPGTTWVASERWLQIGGRGNGDMVLADLQPTPDGASKIRSAWLRDVNDPPPPGAPSLGALVTWWTEALDARVHTWDRAAGRWVRDLEAVPEDRRLTGLV